MPTRFELANAIRALSMDAVQRAGCGHPGMPMGMADIAQVLWSDYLRHNPADPHWFNRDRFMLSNGHGSLLQYSLLHLTGYDLSIEELKNFRQLGSKTPGHPEYGQTPGIEVTTGPLGQGLGNAVGMALAERLLANEFNREGFPIVDHHTYVFAGDGCLMEGVSHEACSLAGALGLGRLIVFYDDNGISIDGDVHGWFRDDTPGRFESYGWQVVRNVNGHDPDEIKAAVETALAQEERPTLICCKTVIGFGAPNKQGTAATHGSALGDEEVDAARKQLGWKYPPFEIPDEIYLAWNADESGRERQDQWQLLFERYTDQYPSEASEFSRRVRKNLPADWNKTVQEAYAESVKSEKPIASRKSSEKVLDVIAPKLPELIGGSADLTGSNNTMWNGAAVIAPGVPKGNYLHYGVREFGMVTALNGMALHGGVIPFGGTFLVFSDYARNAIRLAAMMKIRSIFVLTHDSIGLGEDGPTHQPIEHLASLRLIPGLHVWRPADGLETAVAWKSALERKDGPTAIVLSRQGLDQQPHAMAQRIEAECGGYILWEPTHKPQAILVATGSEVQIAVQAAQRLADEGVHVRVVSMPCVEQFQSQPDDYQKHVLPAAIRSKVAVEAGVTAIWRGLVGDNGDVLGIDRFGESAPGPTVLHQLGIDVEHIMTKVRSLI